MIPVIVPTDTDSDLLENLPCSHNYEFRDIADSDIPIDDYNRLKESYDKYYEASKKTRFDAITSYYWNGLKKAWKTNDKSSRNLFIIESYHILLNMWYRDEPSSPWHNYYNGVTAYRQPFAPCR